MALRKVDCWRLNSPLLLSAQFRIELFCSCSHKHNSCQQSTTTIPQKRKEKPPWTTYRHIHKPSALNSSITKRSVNNPSSSFRKSAIEHGKSTGSPTNRRTNRPHKNLVYTPSHRKRNPSSRIYMPTRHDAIFTPSRKMAPPRPPGAFVMLCNRMQGGRRFRDSWRRVHPSSRCLPSPTRLTLGLRNVLVDECVSSLTGRSNEEKIPLACK